MSGMFSGIVPVVKAYIVDAFDAEEVPKVLAYRALAQSAARVAHVMNLRGGLLSCCSRTLEATPCL